MKYDAKDFIAASITKSAMMEDAGLKIVEYNGDYIIYEVYGVFDKFTSVKKGSRLIKLMDKDIHEYSGLKEIEEVVKREKTVRIEAVKMKDYNNDIFMNDASVNEVQGFQYNDSISCDS